MVKTPYFEDYRVGMMRETLGRTITEADIVTPAGQTGNFFPHHVDAEWSKGSEFGQRVAHGTLILSVGAGMTANEMNPVSCSYGYDRVRFTGGDKRDYPRRASHGLGVERLEVLNQREQIVLACEHLSPVERTTSVQD